MTEPRTLRLFDGIDLQYDDCEANVAEEFAAMFRSTWSRLPGGFRRVVTLYRESYRDQFAVLLKSFDREIAGRFNGKIHSLEFDSGVYHDASTQFDVVIAHELAHVFWLATGQSDHCNPGKDRLSEPFIDLQEGIRACKWAPEILAIEMGTRLRFPYHNFFELFNTELTEPVISAERHQEIISTNDDVWRTVYATDTPAVDVAKAGFFEEHSEYFNVALENEKWTNWTDLDQVKKLIHTES
jgi:hypothetical protein